MSGEEQRANLLIKSGGKLSQLLEGARVLHLDHEDAFSHSGRQPDVPKSTKFVLQQTAIATSSLFADILAPAEAL